MITLGLIAGLFLTRGQILQAAIEITFTSPPEIELDQSFTIDVTINGAPETTEYFLRGAFYKLDTTNYFGDTLNHLQQWHNDAGTWQNFYKITGNQTLPISFKLREFPPNFDVNQPLLFKIGRYTTAGSLTWSNQVEQIIISPSNETSPTITSTVSPSPTTALLITDTPTPTTTPTTSSSFSPRINEFLACPNDSQPEWIELFNPHDSILDLSSYYLTDANQKHLTLSGQLESDHFQIIELSTSILNNSGDTISLFSLEDTLIQSVSYDSCTVSNSWMFDGQNWQESTTPTKGLTNQLTSKPTATPTPTAIKTLVTKTPTTSPTPIIEISEISNSRKKRPSQAKQGRHTATTAFKLPNLIPHTNSTESTIRIATSSALPADPTPDPVFPLISLTTSGLAYLSAGLLMPKSGIIKL